MQTRWKARRRRKEARGRRRRWKRRSAAAASGGRGEGEQEGESKKDKDEEEEDGKEAPEPKWPEVKKAMKEKARGERRFREKEEDGEELDLAMFYCSSVNTLKIE